MPAIVPVIDLTPWFDGSSADRAAVAQHVDQALRTSGFLLITGHGVPAGVRARAVAREFFALPAEVKARYATTVGGRGWLPPGAEANGYAEGTPTPPDLKESFSLAADQPTGDAVFDTPLVPAERLAGRSASAAAFRRSSRTSIWPPSLMPSP